MRAFLRTGGAALALVVASCGGGDSGTTPSYSLSGAVTGLSGTLTLQNNGSETVTISSSGRFAFPSPLEEGTTYQVTVAQQPQDQLCTVMNGVGTVSGADVTHVAVTCDTTAYKVGGIVSGLPNQTSVVLQNNGTDTLTVESNGAFTFVNSVANGATYTVTVATHPAGHACSIGRGVGTVSASAITDVTVSCVANTFTVGGTASGITGTVVLQNHSGDDLSVTTSGPFTFATALNDGAGYQVTVFHQPVGLACTIANGIGTIQSAHVSDVTLECGPTCGNNAINDGEACDDGNAVTETACPYGTASCTRCNSSCSATLNLTGPYCGDSATNGAEACDDGNTISETECPYGTSSCTRCNATCSATLNLTGQYCGDGATTGAETCDDGNTISETECPYGMSSCTRCNATCSATLNLTGQYCGDGATTGAEACDDGNTISETVCPYGTASCTRCNSSCSATLNLMGTYCGDGQIQATFESCDDGNTTNGDGCNNTCTGP